MERSNKFTNGRKLREKGGKNWSRKALQEKGKKNGGKEEGKGDPVHKEAAGEKGHKLRDV